MSGFDWIVLGLLIAVFLGTAVRWRAWKQPTVLLVIGLLLVIGAVIGGVIGLALGAAERISESVFWVAFIALVSLEGYLFWRRRRRS